jgi:hypothetical protein
MTLTTALALLGALVLLAVVGHGWWAARRASPRRAEAPGALALPAERIEPGLGAASSEPPLPGAELRALKRAPRIDALIDAVVPLALEAPASGEMVISHLPATRRAGSKPMLVEGRELPGGEWGAPRAGQRYAELQAGVLLANRSGALNEIEYSEFVQKVQAFADAVGAEPDFPDMLDVVARARELDSLLSPLDAQLTVMLRANSVAWSVAFLQQTAARHGFIAGALPGRLVLPGADDGAPPVLVLAFDAQAALAEDPQSSALRECTLSLDVPQTEEKAEAFPAWLSAARKLADDLDATLVDDRGEPITLHAFAAIGEEIARLYRQLEALDLAAGSPAARRVFS